jgi:hypothetical protein
VHIRAGALLSAKEKNEVQDGKNGFLKAIIYIKEHRKSPFFRQNIILDRIYNVLEKEILINVLFCSVCSYNKEKKQQGSIYQSLGGAKLKISRKQKQTIPISFIIHK